MRVVFFLAMTLNFATITMEQDENFPLQADSQMVDKYAFIGLNQTYLRNNYGDAVILNAFNVKKLEGKQIEKIELVYTDFPRRVDMKALNQERLVALNKLIPGILEMDGIEWVYVKQTGATQESIWSFFHGFSITYTDLPRLGETDVQFIKNVVDGEVAPSDSTIFKVFQRHPDWLDMLVVCDLTGSMSPYVSQVLLWHKLQEKTKKASAFVFFNDGNGTPDKEKKIGKTGGIYTVENMAMDKVMEGAFKTLRGGNGSDGPENDVEALLKGVQSFPNAKEIVLIADNNSEIRDISLAIKIGRPVKIILCGSAKYVHPDYLTLAWKTKGTIHTIDSDLKNMIELSEGDLFTIFGTQYIIRNGQIQVFLKKI